MRANVDVLAESFKSFVVFLRGRLLLRREGHDDVFARCDRLYPELACVACHCQLPKSRIRTQLC